MRRRVGEHAAPGKLRRLDEGEACKTKQSYACVVETVTRLSTPVRSTALQYRRLCHWAAAPPPGGPPGRLFFATAWGCCRPLRSACASGSGRLRGGGKERWLRNRELQRRRAVWGNGLVTIPMRFPVLSLRGAPPPPRPHGWWLFMSASSRASRHSASFLSRSRRSC